MTEAAAVPAGRPVHYERPVQARATVRGVLLLQALANGAGALIVFGYLKILFPEGSASGTEEDELNATVFGAYLLVTLFVALPVNKVFLTKAMRWVREGREPTTAERWATMTQPLQQTFSAFLVWCGAALVFGWIHRSDANAYRVAIGIALAGLVTTTLLYSLLERRFRPIFALALDGATLPRWRREILARLMLAWLLGCAVPLIGVGLAPVGVPAESLAASGTRITALVLGSVLAGGLVIWAAAGSVSAPIEEVTDALARVEDGDLDVHLPVTHVGEIGRLQAGFNQMVHGLRERRRLADLFSRQVGVDVARQALEDGPSLGGEGREITALFVDLENFTAYTETHTPEEVVAELNRFFEVVIRVVMREGGWVNKFEGDAALCIFGAPAAQPDHATRALRAAAALPAEVAELPDAPSVGIGVATGHAVAGYIGTAERYEYTVIGDAVNVASRLTELAKSRPIGVLASEETVAAAGQGAGGWREVDTVRVRGRQAETHIFEPAHALHPTMAGNPAPSDLP